MLTKVEIDIIYLFMGIHFLYRGYIYINTYHVKKKIKKKGVGRSALGSDAMGTTDGKGGPCGL